MFQNIKIAPIIISALVIVGFVAILVLLVVRPLALDEHVADLLKILTGTLSAKFGDVVQYHIGSSAGSKEKDSILKDIATK